MTPGSPRARAVTAALLLVMAAGCSALPESGPVHRDSAAKKVQPEDATIFSAPGPGHGDTPVQIVNGFLTAMTANPLTTSVARSFLTRPAQSAWNPTRATLVYQVSSVADPQHGLVPVRLSEAQRLDSRGGWLGTSRSDSRLRLRMVREGGEWRIANPPDAVVIPGWYLELRFRPFNLYFFDQTERVLVPDRVYLPRGDQTASTLVRALLSGPGADVAPVTRTEFPPQTQLDLSVPVAPDGTAEVPFSDQLLKLPPQKLTRAVAQLAWTLRQVPGLTRLRMTVGGTAVPLPDGRRDFSVQEGDAFAPTIQAADDRLFGLRRGRVVAIRNGAEEVGPGPFGRRGYSLRSIGVRLDGRAIAAVATDGGTVFEAPSPGAGTGDQRLNRVRRVYDGHNMLRPAYDLFGGLWLVDRTGPHSHIVYIARGQTTTVDVPGVSGHKVNAFLVSRDGTRLVAVLDGAGRSDRLVTANLLRSADGAFSRATAATALDGLPSELRDLRDVVWRSPNDLAVLGRPAKGRSEVVFVTLDGSPGDPTTVPPDSWPGDAVALAASPDSSRPLYLVTPEQQLYRLDDSSRWRSSDIAKGLLAPTYVG